MSPPLVIRNQRDVLIENEDFEGDGTQIAITLENVDSATIRNCNGRNLFNFLSAIKVRNLRVLGGDISRIRNDGLKLAQIEGGYIYGVGFHDFVPNPKHRDAIQLRTPDERAGPCSDILIDLIGVRGPCQGVLAKGAHKRLAVRNSQFCIDYAQAIAAQGIDTVDIDNNDIRSGPFSAYRANIDHRGSTNVRITRTLINGHTDPRGRIYPPIVYA